MRPFSINIRGRVKNFNLPKNQPLVPLFEAIVNAIHAIGERKSTDPSFEGQIIIRILRDGQFVLDGTGELPQIQSFEIIDNGIGFNEANKMTVENTRILSCLNSNVRCEMTIIAVIILSISYMNMFHS